MILVTARWKWREWSSTPGVAVWNNMLRVVVWLQGGGELEAVL